MVGERPRVLKFGPFQVDPNRRSLRKRGVRIPLQDQPFQVLVALLRKPNEIVTREELIRTLWPEKEYGEFELGLNTAIRKVRQALGDSASDPTWIETIPKVGYRFLATSDPVLEVRETTGAARKRPYALYGALGVTIAILTLAARSLDWSSSRPAASNSDLVVRPLTSYPGFEDYPALSPDGTRVAFTWNGEDRGNEEVYVRRLDDGALTRVTDHPGRERHPVWSPDGEHIAFIRSHVGRAILHLATISEPESERELAQLDLGAEGGTYGLDWSPDGRFIAVQNIETTAGRQGIFFVDAATGEMRRVTSPPKAFVFDRWPSFSPDGRLLAFARGQTNHSVYAVELDETGWPVGEEFAVTEAEFYIRGLDWSPDGNSLIFGGAAEGGRMELRSVDFASKVVSNLLDDVEAQLPSAARRKRDSSLMVAFVQVSNDNDLFRIQGPAALSGGMEGQSARPFASSTRYDHSPRFSQDDRQVAFVSHRSGASELWVADRDGNNPRRLTEFGGRRGAAIGSPRWSPDDQWIAFEAGVDGNEDLFIISSSGGEPTRLTTHPSNDTRAAFSPDGKSLYFSSDRLGTPEIWKMSAEGGEPTRMTFNGGQDASLSADGKWIYFAKRYGQFGDPGIFRMPIGGGDEERILERGKCGRWALTESGIYLYRPAEGGAPAALDYYPHKTLEPQTIYEFSATSKFGTANALTVSGDDRTVVFVQKPEPSADLALAGAE